MTAYYSKNQLGTILPFLKRKPKWLVLGGVADANEAQYARVLWPEIKVIGVEPNPEAAEWQRTEGQWPADCPLVGKALADRIGYAPMVYQHNAVRNASLDHDAVAGNIGNPNVRNLTVPTTTLDALDAEFGPFEDAIVWADIEGSEWRMLQGAPNLVASGRVQLWNLELLDRVPGLVAGVHAILEGAGYHAVYDWNASAECRDRVFVKKE